MNESENTACRFQERAEDFVRSASVICTNIHNGWLPSTCLLLGFACELLAKQRLLREGISEEELRKEPYGHNIAYMWREKTSLFEEGEIIVETLKMYPSSEGVGEHFNWNTHFDELAAGHSKESDYSIRYHQGKIEFTNPKAVTVVLSKICLAIPC